MGKKEHLFNEIVRKVRKDLFGKGPDSIKTVFIENMAISTLTGNLTPVEQFIATTKEGAEQVHRARTKMIQDWYREKVPEGMEELMQAKLVHLFSDIHVKEDIAVSVFVFDQPIQE